MRRATNLLAAQGDVSTSVTAGGTTNRVAKFTSAYTIGDSTIVDNGTTVSPNGDNTIPLGAAATRWANVVSVLGTFGTTPATVGAVIRLPNSTTAISLATNASAATAPAIGINASDVLITNAGNAYFAGMRFDATGSIVINDDGQDTDFRIESDTNSNFLVGDAGLNSGAGAFGFGAAAVAGTYLNVTSPAGITGMTFNTLGANISLKEGANAAQGVVTLSGSGTAIVYTTRYTATSRIWLTPQAVMGTQGSLKITTTTTSVQFTIESTNAADRSIVAWQISESN